MLYTADPVTPVDTLITTGRFILDWLIIQPRVMFWATPAISSSEDGLEVLVSFQLLYHKHTAEQEKEKNRSIILILMAIHYSNSTVFNTASQINHHLDIIMVMIVCHQQQCFIIRLS
jgi:hypothetical protein